MKDAYNDRFGQQLKYENCVTEHYALLNYYNPPYTNFIARSILYLPI